MRISSVSGWRAGRMASYTHSGWPFRVSWSRYRLVMTNSVGWKYRKLRAAYRSSDSISSTSARTRPVRSAWVSTQGGDALDLVGALLVVDHGLPRGPEDGGDHLHRGGLAVGAGDGDDVFRQLHPGEDVRTDLQGELAGHGAALAHQLGPRRGPACTPRWPEIFSQRFRLLVLREVPETPRWRGPARRRRSQISGAGRRASGPAGPPPSSGTGSPGSPARPPAGSCGRRIPRPAGCPH